MRPKNGRRSAVGVPPKVGDCVQSPRCASMVCMLHCKAMLPVAVGVGALCAAVCGMQSMRIIFMIGAKVAAALTFGISQDGRDYHGHAMQRAVKGTARSFKADHLMFSAAFLWNGGFIPCLSLRAAGGPARAYVS